MFENEVLPSWRSSFSIWQPVMRKNMRLQNLTISAYAASLESSIKKRYIEKISVIRMDPLLFPVQKYTSECLPSVEVCDLLSYLVLKTSFYTNDQFKNFRSLLPYNHMVSGFITSVLGQIIHNKFVALAKVRHSQRMNDPHVQLWIITTADGRNCCFSTLCGMYGWSWRMLFSYCECSFLTWGLDKIEW